MGIIKLGALAVFPLALHLAASFCSPVFAGETWGVYLYLCGSDLETEHGAASEDLVESLRVELPENVRMVVQAGGAGEWEFDDIDSGMTHILLRSGDGMEVIDRIPNANMGDPRTLYDFLSFCEENYPADRKMLILWNHGGGSAGGICYDELFDDDALDFAELRETFEDLYGEEPDEKPFEIIGFDACLMATVDMAGLCAPFANYMVASQDNEPSCGWKYDDILSALAEKPGMDGEELGRIICDSYYDGCAELGLEDNVTLSVIDLDRVDDLRLALSLVSVEGIMTLVDSPSGFYAELGRGAAKADSYSSGMADLASFVRGSSRNFPEFAEIVQDAIAEAVVYQVKGRYRKNSNGIAVYIPTPGNREEYEKFGVASGVGGTKSIYHLFEPLMNGGFSEDTLAFVEELGAFLEDLEADDEDSDSTAQGSTPSSPGTVGSGLSLVSPGSLAGASSFVDTSEMGFADHPLEYFEEDDISYVRLNLGPEKAEMLQSVTFMLAMIDEDFSEMIVLGEDSDADVDWDAGVFTDNFRGVWGSIDGYYVLMHVTSLTDDYVLYESPLIIDGKLYNLTVAFDYDTKEYRMLSARLDESETGGLPSREERLLKEGDTVTTVFFKSDMTTGEIATFRNETFTLGKNPRFSELTLPDGMYAMLFLMTDYKGMQYYSDLAGVIIEDGDAVIFDLAEHLESLAAEGMDKEESEEED